jgi:hypothetical protein
MKTSPPVPKALLALRWAGRILATFLVLFWGLFFVEHTIEWFVQPWPATPPAAVWIGHATHLALLVSLLALWRWEVVGGLAVIVLGFAFFVDKAGPNFPLFFAVTALPALLALAAAGWQYERRRHAAAA